MTHRERVLSTFRFEETDRVPCDLMEGTVWAELLDTFRNRSGFERATQLLDYLDTDFRWAPMVRTDQIEYAEERLPAAERSGDLSKAIAKGPLEGATTVAEVEAHDWVDPATFATPDYSVVRRRWPDHALVVTAGWWPLFWGTCEAFGVESALLNLVHNPALFEASVKSIHERYLDRLSRVLTAARYVADICWLGDDFATQESMFLSPAHWRRFIKPYLAEQVALARSHGMIVLYHSCGSIRPVIRDLIDIGVNGHLVFQTSARDMEPESIAAEFGGQIVFYGGMDVQQLLSFGDSESVANEVKRNTDAFRRCGGYVVANSHHRVLTIRGELIEAMCLAAHESGPIGIGD